MHPITVYPVHVPSLPGLLAEQRAIGKPYVLILTQISIDSTLLRAIKDEVEMAECNIEGFSICACSGFVEQLLDSISNVMRMKEFKYSGDVDDEIFTAIGRCLPSFTDLTRIDIGFRNAHLFSTSRLWDELDDGTQTFANLEQVDVTVDVNKWWFSRSDPLMQYSVVDCIMALIQRAPRLSTLRLLRCQVSFQAMNVTTSLCCGTAALRKLVMAGSSIDPVGFSMFANRLPHMNGLKVLDLRWSYCEFPTSRERVEEELAGALADNANRIGNTSLTDIDGVWLDSGEFYCELNKAGFRGRPQDSMTNERWLSTLVSLQTKKQTSYHRKMDNVTFRLGLVHYFLLYDPTWWCRV